MPGSVPVEDEVVELTTEQAADRYLDVVCPTNELTDALGAVFQAGYDEHTAGGSPDVTPIREAASALLDSYRIQVELLDDEGYAWPEEVVDLIDVIQDADFLMLTSLSKLKSAEDFDAAFNTPAPDLTEAATAAQKIRYELGIDPDTYESCVGHEDGHERLTAAG
jgi:hypothetical protein